MAEEEWSGVTLALLTRQLEQALRESEFAIHPDPGTTSGSGDILGHNLAPDERAELLNLTIRAMQSNTTPPPWATVKIALLSGELDRARHEGQCVKHAEPGSIDSPTDSLRRYLAADDRAKRLRRAIRAIEHNAAALPGPANTNTQRRMSTITQ